MTLNMGLVSSKIMEECNIDSAIIRINTSMEETDLGLGRNWVEVDEDGLGRASTHTGKSLLTS